jgi:hypothetical protein
MRNRYVPLLFFFLTCSLDSLFAQSPGRLSYQAVVRNTSGSIVSNQSVRMRITVVKGSATGTDAYVETHSRTTNALGLVSLEIGGGTVVSGNFSTIAWSQGPYFLKTETDVTGGTNYQLSGTTQLLSVPYALYASDMSVTKNGDTLNIGSSRLVVPGAQLFKPGMPPGIHAGLLGSYSFSGNANDESGNGNHGTVNGATLTTDRFGGSNAAYLFNGINQNIVMPPMIKGLSSFTFSLWFRLIDWQSPCTSGKYLISLNSLPNGSLPGGDGVSIGRHPMANSSNLLFGIFDFAPGIGWQWINSGVNPSPSTFYHVAGTFDGAQMRMYLNGNLVGTIPYSKAIHTFSDKIFIGSSSYSCSYVNAVVDDVKVYNRALTQAEIKYLSEN